MIAIPPAVDAARHDPGLPPCRNSALHWFGQYEARASFDAPAWMQTLFEAAGSIVSAPSACREHRRIIAANPCPELAMIRALFDLCWWFADRAWGFARAWTGDDVYERYLAEHHRVDPDGPVLARAAFFARHLEEKWRRYVACGRSADRS